MLQIGAVIARVEEGDRKLLYHWKGWHTRPDLANVPFHGFGEMDFDSPSINEKVTHGAGKFWNVDEAHPERTIVKPTQLCRVAEENVISTMSAGKGKAVEGLVKKVLLDW